MVSDEVRSGILSSAAESTAARTGAAPAAIRTMIDSNLPLESRVDYMRLHSGKTFSIPFDELIIFATNLTPSDLMDPAFLRRIPYKIETLGPSVSDFRVIFERVSRERGLELQEETLSFVVQEITEYLLFVV